MGNGSRKAFTFLLLFGLFPGGCRTGSVDGGRDLERYRQYLEITRPDRVGLLDADTASEAVRKFVDFYAVYSKEIIQERLRTLYREDIYFRDPFHEVEGIEALEEYFIRAADPVEECRFEIQDVSAHEGEYYFRWIMHLRLKRDKDKESSETPGMSHVRFDPDGRIVFHVDYWDPSLPVYGRIPVLRSLIGAVRRRI